MELLDSRGMLPAIVFIFSRAQCEDAVRSCARDGLVLTSAEEEDEIISIVESRCAVLSEDDKRALEYDAFLETVGSGIACHHAGMIPMFKESVEECFVRGLVKVVFATETLAVGINMPARAVVIEKLTKFTGEHHALLRASEYAQLTGRAGRRGLDEIGHAVTLWSPWVTFDQAAGLALSRSFRLSSAFRPTFNMAANMIGHHSREATMHVLNLSFAQFQADREIVTSEAQLDRKRRELMLLERERAGSGMVDESGAGGEAGDHDVPDTAGAVEAEIALRSLRPGDVVIFDAANVRGRGLVLSTASRRSGVRLTVLLPTRKIVDVTGRDLRSLPHRASHVDLPQPFEPARTEFLKEAAARLVRARVDESHVARPVSRDRHDRDSLDTRDKALKRLRREIEQMSARAESRSGSVYGRFMDVTSVLAELGYVEGWSLLPKGKALSSIFHESDILVVEVMTSGVLRGLSAVDLAGVVSALVFEPRNSESGAFRWPNDTVRQRIKRIDKISERLHEVERRHGLHQHRPPHPGLSWETSAWASGQPLSAILDPELTPGDFVRSMRQLIDLLRQIASASDEAEVRSTAEQASRAIDRGVVAAAAAGGAG
ncbi:MAG: helicase-related protein [Ilumatobacteraceae bacterium]